MKNYGTICESDGRIRVLVSPLTHDEKRCMSSDKLTEDHDIPDILFAYNKKSDEISCLYSIEPCLHWIGNPNSGTIGVENIRIKRTGEIYRPKPGEDSPEAPIFSVTVEIDGDDFELYKSLIEDGGDYSVRKLPAIRVEVTPVSAIEKECMSSKELDESDNIPEFLAKYIRTSSIESCLHSMGSYLHLICNPNGGTINVENVWIKQTGEVFIPETGVQKASDENISYGLPIYRAIVEIYEDDLERFMSLITSEFGDGYSVQKIAA